MTGTDDRTKGGDVNTLDRPEGGRPNRATMSEETRRLHDSVDACIRRQGAAFLHPDGESTTLDLLGSRAMIDWQEEKARKSFLGDACWSSSSPVYARYGTESARRLLERVNELEGATATVLTDSGMQASALLLDVLFEPHAEAVVARGSYNKTKAFLRRLAERQDGRVRFVDDASLRQIEQALTESTRIVFVETYSNPLTRAVDVPGLVALVSRARTANSSLRLVVDHTVASPWGIRSPLLELGVDFVVSSGTKALDGRDRNMWGYISSHRVREMNDVMDLQAMRGGILDWRKAADILTGLDDARKRFERRCNTASLLAGFLARHRLVEEVYHPSLGTHPDHAVVHRDYQLPGSLLSFRLRNTDESTTRHFCDVLATTGVPRYALSFDGLVTKINHHRTVSEYFTPEDEVRAMGVDRLVRIGVGLEDADDLIACFDWALANFARMGRPEVAAWQRERRRELRLSTAEKGCG